MSDIKLDARGPEGERGPRGKRGHEGHEGPTGPTGPASSPPLIAAASIVGADGSALANTGFSATVRLAAGRYQLTLANPPPDAKVVPVVTIRSNPVVATLGEVVSVAGGVITVHTMNPTTGIVMDADFFILVSQGA